MGRVLFGGLSLCLVVLVAASVQAAVVREFPPFEQFQRLENPNQRVVPLADDLNYRLPNETVPVEYDITLTTNVHTGDTHFTGVVAITVSVLTKTEKIVIHARQLENFTATAQQLNVENAEVHTLNVTYEDEREFLTLYKEGLELPEDTTWLVTINYEGNLRTDNGGFYLSTYTDDEGNTKYLATTQFESTDARHAFPCYDEPSKRANFTITIKHDPSYNAISNMPVNETTSRYVTPFGPPCV